MMYLRKLVKSVLPEVAIQAIRQLLTNSEKLSTQDEWLGHMNKLIKRDIRPYIPESTSNSKPLALFWVPQINTPHMYLEFLIGMALQLRGWDVKYAICNGNLPHCPYENAHSTRPTCEICRAQSDKIIKTFNLQTIQLLNYVSNDEITAIYSDVCSKAYLDLVNTIKNSYEIGKISNELLNYYYFGIADINGNVKFEETFRRIFAGNLISYLFAERLLKDYSPQLAIMLNGQAFHTQAGYFCFKDKGIRTVTWDGYPPYEDSFIFSQQEPSVLGYIDDEVWKQESEKPLSIDEEKEVNLFLDRWKQGSIGDIKYHPSPQTSIHVLRDRLLISPNKRTFLAFTNVIWDSACLGRNVGFNGILDWLFSLINWFVNNQDTHQLVIRIHPAEKRLPTWAQTDFGMEQCIHSKYPDLPSNIIIVGAEDDAYSYSLAEIADGIGVYTTSLGYELAAQGKRVWVAGEVHYRGHGFTQDIKDKDHLYQLLDTDWGSELSSKKIEQAKKYIHLRFFRQVVRIPFLHREKIVYTTRPFFKNLRFLFPQIHDPLLGTLIDKIVDGTPFIDIPSKTNAMWRDVKV